MLMMTIPAADPLPLPAPPWLLWALLTLTFTLHVLAMNLALGGSVIALVARLRAAGDDERLRLAQSIGRLIPTVLAAAITFGVAPLLFVQALYGRLFFSSAVLMGWFWFAVVPLLIVAYYGAYAIAFRRGATAVATIVTLILVAIAFIYSNNMTLMLRPERFLPMYLADARGLQLNLVDATLAPRFLHMLLGAMAIAGACVAIYGVAKRRSDPEYGAWVTRQGARWFVVATAMNLVSGIWWLGVLPREILLRFMGRNSLATTWLAAGIALGLLSLILMISRHVTASSTAALITVVLMILARDDIRRGMLENAGFAQTTLIEPQWGVIALFAVLLVAALMTTGWMVRTLIRAPA